MKKLTYLLLAFVGIMTLLSCDDSETYAEQKDRERAAIMSYLTQTGAEVINEAKFFMQDSMTDISRNQFVYLSSSGVYMQIIRKGSGEKLKDGEEAKVLCRFTERNLLLGADSILLTNDILYYSSTYDKMSVSNNSGTYTASFMTPSLMSSTYGAAVPAGWLAPLPYINLGRQSKDGIAKVRLIVPHTQGQAYASQSVYPCLYDISYQRGI